MFFYITAMICVAIAAGWLGFLVGYGVGKDDARNDLVDSINDRQWK